MAFTQLLPWKMRMVVTPMAEGPDLGVTGVVMSWQSYFLTCK